MRVRASRNRLALALAVFAAMLVAQPIESASAALSGVDLSTYVRVGRYDLPVAPAPAGSQLAREASGVAYNWDNDSLYVVGDEGTSVAHVSKTGALIDSMTLSGFDDTEGITYVGGGQFVVTEERLRQVVRFTYAPGTTLAHGSAQAVKLGTTIGNIGLEGVSNDPQTGGLLLVKESDPKGIFSTGVDWAAGTATNGSPTTENSTDLFDPALTGLADHSDVYALANVAALAGTADESHLLMISQASGKVINISRTGVVSSTLTLVGDADNALSIPDQTHEGVTMDAAGYLYIVSEQGGGDGDHPQVWVYAPSTGTNAAPTGVSFTTLLSSLPENASTATRTKLANVNIADDGLGTNNLTVTGADADSFEVDATGLYLKAGVTLNHTTKPSYTVQVAVDDPGVGSTPDASSADFTLTITAASGGPGTATIKVTEVSPWSSGNSPYAADWFEVTNTGTSALDLTGWRIDDDSNVYGSAVLLQGVGSLAAGESAIFVGGDADTPIEFRSSWFGASSPAGLQVGTFDAGLGLSSGGDQVNLFDNLGNHQTGVAFGASTTGRTFDNAAGDATVTTLATAGVNGAFTSPDNEVGSPGRIAAPAPPPNLKVTEVAPWGSGDGSYAADWFELTNKGATTVDLTGYKMDDSSDASGTAVALTGVPSLAPGESAIFLEGTSATPAAFKTGWFGSSVPAGLQVGYYGGSGVGLSTSGDAVNVFNGAGTKVTGVTFGASTSKVSFDNAPGDAAVTTLSAVGTNGAFTSATGGEVGSPGTIVSPPPLAQAKVTEVAPWGSGDGSYLADWFELTNTGATTIDLTGWKMDDSSNAIGTAVALTGVSSLAPGESAIFLEGTSATPPLFRSGWFGSDVPFGLQVGYYGGSGVGLSTSGDGVNVFDALGRRVTGVTFGASTSKVSFDNAAGDAAVTALSAVGTNGAFTSATGGEVGSPGLTATPPALPLVKVTEVSPWSSGDSSYAADWFELTNTGDTTVDLTGWKVDDSSNAFASAVALNGVSSLAPGASAIFTEGTADTPADLIESWFGADPPAGLQVGFYGGSGVGLSTGGDAINVFTATGRRVTGIAFGGATSGRTFDNAAGAGSSTLPLPVVTTLSTVGIDGARTSDADEVGSPGTITPDTTKPVLTLSGNQGVYVAGQLIRITCAAVDERFGSGVAEDACAEIELPSASLGLGTHQLTATATDRAGNVGTATANVVVVALPAAGSGSTPPPATPTPTPPAPSSSGPSVSTPPASSGGGSATPAEPSAPTPSVDAPDSVKPGALTKGVTTKLEDLRPGSRIAIEIRVGGKVLKAFKATANQAGDGSVKLKLSRKQLAKVGRRDLIVRYTVVDEDGSTRTISTRIAVG